MSVRMQRLLALGVLLGAAGLTAMLVLGPIGVAKGVPPGNNGTVKIDGIEFDDHPNNEPHPSCIFQVDFYGFDEGALFATVTFRAHPPTGSGDILLTDSVFIGEDAAGGGTDLDASGVYDLSGPLAAFIPHPIQGFHVKLTINAEGSQGADTKHKVFWVECEAPVTTTTTSTTTPRETSTTTTSTTAPRETSTTSATSTSTTTTSTTSTTTTSTTSTTPTSVTSTTAAPASSSTTTTTTTTAPPTTTTTTTPTSSSIEGVAGTVATAEGTDPTQQTASATDDPAAGAVSAETLPVTGLDSRGLGALGFAIVLVGLGLLAVAWLTGRWTRED